MGNSRSSRRNKTGTKTTTQKTGMNLVTQNTVCNSLSAPPVETPLPPSPLPSVPLPPTKKDRRPVNPVARSVQSRVPVWRNAHGDMISITTSHPIESTNDSSSDSSPRLTHNATPVHEHHRNPSPDHHHYHNQHSTDLSSHHHHSDPFTSSQHSYTVPTRIRFLLISQTPLSIPINQTLLHSHRRIPHIRINQICHRSLNRIPPHPQSSNVIMSFVSMTQKIY